MAAVALVGAVLSAAIVVPGPAVAMSFRDARHLAARTGFGPGLAIVARLEQMDRGEAVDWLLAGARSAAVTPPPGWTKAPPRRDSRAIDVRRAEAYSLRAWWYREMVRSPSPLTERMTLLWHGHFATSIAKVGSPLLMYRQNVRLRRHAVGNFRDLLHALSKDPALLIQFDNVKNRKDAVNDRFARALLGVFTLGEGHYKERDVRGTARAFTGWGVDRVTGEFAFGIEAYDKGSKDVLWWSGNFNGDDIINIILAQKRAAIHITEKMWRAFVSETPDKAAVDRIATRFRASNYDIKVLLAGLLKSPHFWESKTRARLVKSPVDLIAGTIRLFRGPVPPGWELRALGRKLGQDVFAPPGPKGWPGGTRWLTTDSLSLRRQVVRRLTGQGPGPILYARHGAPGGPRERRAGADLDRWFDALPPARRRPEIVQALVLPAKPGAQPTEGADPVKYVRALLRDAAYQLR